MRSSRSVLLGTAVCALLAAAAVTPVSASTIVPGNTGRTVSAAGDTVVYSTYDAAAGTWRLAVRENGAIRLLKAAPSPVAFDADLGTNTAGAPAVIYQRCTGDETTPAGCELYVITLAAGASERPVRNANDPAHNDMTPTLWRGRIAWTRVYGTAAEPNPVVYTKLLTAPRSQPSRRLPGVPAKRCAMELGLVDPPCGPTTHRSVRSLELWGDRLGMVVGYIFEGLAGISQQEVRLDTVSTGASSEISYVLSGLAAQGFRGPSFSDGKLAWYKTCGDGSEPTCRSRVGPWRYDIAKGTYQRGAPGPVAVYGFADTGSRLYEVTGCDILGNPQTTPVTCRIDAVTPPTYTAAPTPELATAKPPTT